MNPSLRPTFEEAEESSHVEFAASKDEKAQSGQKQDSVDGSMSTGPRVKKLKFLYIQMQLCEKSTLR